MFSKSKKIAFTDPQSYLVRLLLVFYVVGLASVCSALEIKRHASTWTITGNPTSGTYANGDPWVVGPVAITNITPSSTVTGSGRTINGTMINPTAAHYPAQGLDSKMGKGAGLGWNAALNVGRPGGSALSVINPLVVAVGSSVCSSVGHPNDLERPTLTDFAVLTVVASPPAAGSFRPPYCGTDKTHHWNTSQLNYEVMQNLPPVKGATTPSALVNQFDRTWVEISTSQPGYTGFRASNNQSHYGRDMDNQLGGALLHLHLNFSKAEKEPLFIRLVQYGLDIYGAAASDPSIYWDDQAGIVNGQKAPLVLAALALNDAKLLTLAADTPTRFSIDRQIWYVTEDDVGRQLDTVTGKPAPSRFYEKADVGMAEWGQKHTNAPRWDNPDWGAVYRDVVYNGGYGTALFAHLTPGMKAAWNHNAYFDYFDRVRDETKNTPGTIFVNAMWAAYRNGGHEFPARPQGLRTIPKP